ncbi:MAG TPA: UDP-3-O-(3-hydroxymyristoyl)glucosamine N-acyltransferase [Thermodesulfobacteriota bacterium]|nr:UDP-3-O-(3-hydroxymyristoyl)glucosamine N-acyltransferase [Thermodesulfobacteriota bacterium]
MMEKTLEEIAALVDGRLEGDGTVVVKGVAPIDSAGPGDLSFIADAKHLRLLSKTRASAVIVREGAPEAKGLNLILVKNPQFAFARAVEVLKPPVLPPPGVHLRAEVSEKAVLGKDVSIGAFSCIEAGAIIGDHAVIFPGVYIGRNALVGEDSVLYSGVSVREGTVIGKRVIIHCNSVIGSDGFGYGFDGSRYFKIPQRGIVRVEDDVEIGACVTVDRATLGETIIGRGTKIDNLVQVAHNVKIGEHTVITAQVGIAGSSTVGSLVQLGGQAGLAGHITVGDRVMVAAKAGVTKDIPAGRTVSGFPAISHTEWLRAQTVFPKLPEIKKTLQELLERVEALEKESPKE